jgi:hypothetical protein
MKLIKEQLTFLQALVHLPKKQVRHILLNANKSQLEAISEIAHNIMAKVLPLSEKHITALKAHRAVIRKLSTHTATLHHRKLQTYLANKAEGVSLMLRAVLPSIQKAL